LGRLLEKDPVKRISWEHLRKHPFWTKEINQRKIPRHPTFDAYLSSRGINPDEYADLQAKQGYFIPDLKHFKQPKRINPLRVSQKILKNMQKNDTNYQIEEDNKKNQDIRLMSRDQQIDFGAHGSDDEDGKEKIESFIASERDAETPVLKEEPLLPKIADQTVDIFKKKPEDRGNAGRLSMKGFMKEDLEELNNKTKATSKYEETKGKDSESKKVDDSKE